MYTLGLAGGFDPVYKSLFHFEEDLLHDAAAVLLRDGEVVAGIEEERLNRIKHTNKVWSGSVAFCLEQAGIGLEQVDAIAVYVSEAFLDRSLLHLRLTKPEAFGQLQTAREVYRHLFQRELGRDVPLDKFHFVHHHEAHAATAYYLSGFDDCLVLTVDGSGDDVSSTVYDARARQFTPLLSKAVAESLGFFYLDVIRFLGYRIFDEYKVMGLAPYGDGSRYRELFKSFYSLLPDGDYILHRERIYRLYQVLEPRKRGEPFNQVHKDLAAALQDALEDIVFHMLRHFQAVTGHDRLAIAGGVGQNSSMNGAIAQSGLFREVFAPSFAADSGCAVGAAMHVAHRLQPSLPLRPVSHAYWGTPVPEKPELESQLSAWRDYVHIEAMENRSERVAELIVGGAVVGWVQGRSEFGPRALGNRSIIADPRVAEHKQTINAMIKKREGYRPFAPSVLEEYAGEYFQMAGEGNAYPFMAFVLPVQPDKRESLPAITHVDGSARLQTVSRRHNPRYWELIEAFRGKTGIPMLLNTSFNNNAEPIVDSVDDAVVCYLTSGLDYLVVGDYLMSKRQEAASRYGQLKLALPKAAQVSAEYAWSSPERRELRHRLSWNYDKDGGQTISGDWHDVLCRSDGATSVDELMQALGWSEARRSQALAELPALWSDRWLCLHPRAT